MYKHQLLCSVYKVGNGGSVMGKERREMGSKFVKTHRREGLC